ncbi:MAG TPA: LamG domain-containing protein, partial [Pseudomonadales bacterium]|nr:LamG domain-containing protein [Pseudomonadales bacterium]
KIALEQYNGINQAASATAITKVTLPLGQWVHVAAVYDGNGGVKIYFNGQEQSLDIPNAFEAPTNITRTNSFAGKSNWYVADANFDGQLTELRIWSTARTEAEIRASMNAVLSGSDLTNTALRGYWNGSSVTNGTIEDLSSFNNTAYLHDDFVRLDQFTSVDFNHVGGSAYTNNDWDIAGFTTNGESVFLYYYGYDASTRIIEHDMTGQRIADHQLTDVNGNPFAPGNWHNELVYQNGFLYMRNANATASPDDDVVYQISLDTSTVRPVTVTGGASQLSTMSFWMFGTLFAMPDGRLGTIDVNSDRVRLFTLSPDGLTMTLDEQIQLNADLSAWLNDSHGSASDGRYLYLLNQ